MDFSDDEKLPVDGISRVAAPTGLKTAELGHAMLVHAYAVRFHGPGVTLVGQRHDSSQLEC